MIALLSFWFVKCVAILFWALAIHIKVICIIHIHQDLTVIFQLYCSLFSVLLMDSICRFGFCRKTCGGKQSLLELRFVDLLWFFLSFYQLILVPCFCFSLPCVIMAVGPISLFVTLNSFSSLIYICCLMANGHQTFWWLSGRQAETW